MRQVRSLLVWMATSRVETDICRACGLALYSVLQTRTLAAGWWGIGAPAALVATIGNYRQSRQLRRFARPAFRDPAVVSPTPAPAWPAWPPSRRPLAWISPISASGLAAVLAAAAVANAGAASPQPITTPASYLGTCWTDDGNSGYSRRVDCSSAGARWVVTQLQPTSALCPGPYLSVSDQYACLEPK